jgi:hypothetical protein
MAHLTPEQQEFVVSRLACFDTPTAVALAVKEEFAMPEAPSRQAVQAYDPDKHAGRNLDKRLAALFRKTRRRFLEDTRGIGITHKAVRLRRLDDMQQRAQDRGNIPLAAQLLEQAAKECGDAFTNKQKIDATTATSITFKVANYGGNANETLPVVGKGQDDGK